MIADETRALPALGSPDATLLEADAFHHAIVTLIEHQLPVWRDRPQRPPFQDEPKLNQSLCLHLNRAARHVGFEAIEFTQEPIQSGSRRGDIGVMAPGTITVEGRDYEDWVQLLPIECKRMPTPPDSRRSDCEYVHGLPGHRNGAIERFKHGLHGPKNPRAMIIAYIQEKSFAHWLQTINARLAKLAGDAVDDGLWSPTEFLKARNLTRADLHPLISTHRRKGQTTGNQIQINHLWLQMN
jgi:hypothetical protein